ncbi:hypothetical protein AGABI1DRAFT_59386 [Agaricus bisporus var. burnettii JB137-S8]|uniref:Ion transport domain-containing protein n=1 Tax=Agaricus bisporus var. burnettii (strain JB137-S8 / ATCC MYA-4627 / FGSC 10392) TaxID=597362 RepID=K5VYW5_AGABU|nr:uncharacterized protein AGABI1DRAFT_59386 [Agaricus bisporus var. burnettii JB137-S8]EKM79679.1 hypothetical protein AGABI1DRAFT_59386 [Agaricus bisporus var. burnettii JB137-S8]
MSIGDDPVFESIKPGWKHTLFALLERPTSSPAALLLYAVSTGLIIFSAIVTVLETVPAFHSISNRIWFGIETSFVALFTVEYIARCIAWSPTWMTLFKWMFSFFGIVDVLAVLPYYIELLLQKDTSILFRFSILRMFRLLRVFRPFRYSNTILLTIEIMFLSVRRSQHALLAILFFVIMILTVFSTLLYFIERGTWDETLQTFINYDGDPSQFSSIPAAGWFVIVTITTVGYGEITPRSFWGQLVTVPILFCGLLLISLPSFVLGREFSLVYERMTSQQEQRRENNEDGNEENGPDDITTQNHLLYALSPLIPPARSSGGGGGGGSRRHPMPTTPTSTSTPTNGDLSNLKLAQNQTELSRQISELAATVEVQGRLLKRLVTVLDVEDPSGERELNGKGKQTQFEPVR